MRWGFDPYDDPQAIGDPYGSFRERTEGPYVLYADHAAKVRELAELLDHAVCGDERGCPECFASSLWPKPPEHKPDCRIAAALADAGGA